LRDKIGLLKICIGLLKIEQQQDKSFHGAGVKNCIIVKIIALIRANLGHFGANFCKEVEKYKYVFEPF
jgi:hypothetical protein